MHHTLGFRSAVSLTNLPMRHGSAFQSGLIRLLD